MAQAITSISSVSTVLQDECHSPSRLSPVILGLQELELLLDPVAGLSYSKLEWLARLVGDLNPDATACEEKEQEELSHQSSGSRHSHTDGNVAYKRSLSLAFFFFFWFYPVLSHVNPRTVTVTRTQLRTLDNERNCLCKGAVARKLDLN